MNSSLRLLRRVILCRGISVVLAGVLSGFRIRDEKGYLTIKGASNASGTSRYEWEKELALSEAEELMRLCEPGIIDKTRYLVRSGKHVFENRRVFMVRMKDLLWQEVELESEDEAFVNPTLLVRR